MSVVPGQYQLEEVNSSHIVSSFDPQQRGMLVVWIMSNQHDDCVDLDRMRKLLRSVSSF